MRIGSEDVVGLHNAPFNPPELCIERSTLALHSSALATYKATETDLWLEYDQSFKNTKKTYIK